VCKQCYGKSFKTPWVDELERADELTEPLGLQALFWVREISAEDMVALQVEDDDLSPVIEWLKSGYVPEGEELRQFSLTVRSLWGQKDELQLRDEVLERVRDNVVQLVVPQVIRRSQFDNVHSGSLAAHLGIERTITQLKTGLLLARYEKGCHLMVPSLYRLCSWPRPPEQASWQAEESYCRGAP